MKKTKMTNIIHRENIFKKKPIALFCATTFLSVLPVHATVSTVNNGQIMTVDDEKHKFNGNHLVVGYRSNDDNERPDGAILNVVKGGRLDLAGLEVLVMPQWGSGFHVDKAVVNINNGGIITVNETSASIGGSSYHQWSGDLNTGELNITGEGSQFIDKGGDRGFYVGYNGSTGIINITDGGKAIINNDKGVRLGIAKNEVTPPAAGHLNIDGVGSSFYSKGYVIIGDNGEGHVNISNGGLLQTDSHIYFGNQAYDLDNSLSIKGEGSTTKAENIYIGSRGKGTVNVSDGGALTANGKIIVGSTASASFDNALSITGDNSIASADKFYAGSDGNGSIRVSNGGTLLGNTDSSFLVIANKEGSSGKLIIGSDENEIATVDGNVDIGKIYFQAGDGEIMLNHTGNNFHLVSDLITSKDKGLINALHGTSYLEGDNSQYNGRLTIADSAIIGVKGQKNLGDSIITNNGELHLQSDSDFQWSNDLSGNGVLDIDVAGHHFSFSDSEHVADFSGTLNVKNAEFILSGINTDALSHATLSLGENSITHVGEGSQSIGSLVFNGGTLDFATLTPGQTSGSSTLNTTQTLDLSGSGAVQVNVGQNYLNMPHTVDNTLPLLQQDDANISIKLAGSDGDIIGSAGGLSLLDGDGSIISDAVNSNVLQNKEVVANAEYNYRLTSGNQQDGLYINYGLRQVELLAQGKNALTLNAESATGAGADLSALLTGKGDLIINTGNGVVSLSNKNNDYTGQTHVASGTLQLGSHHTLGKTSLLVLAENTALDMAGYAQTLAKVMTQTGSTLALNAGQLTVNNGNIDGAITGDGQLNIIAGTLNINSNNNEMSARTSIAHDGRVNLNSAQGLGNGDVNNQGILTLGKQSQVTRDTASTEWHLGSLINSGTVLMGQEGHAAGNELVVDGSYDGQNGHIAFNTVLNGDDSTSDKLTIKGNSSGQTSVSVNNMGGRGATTVNGIELIRVEGLSEGEFTQSGRIVAGAYDYHLVRGQDYNSGNWYLSNAGSQSESKEQRPEAGSYIANLTAANTLFSTRLNDRSGDTRHINAITGEPVTSSLWLRQEGGHNRWRSAHGQLHTQSNRYVLQMGGEFARWEDAASGRFHLGAMAGYANSRSRTHSTVSGNGSKGHMNGYSTGLYGTWYANEGDNKGLYVDTWALYNWFDNHVEGDGISSESYHSKGVTASVETGYSIKMADIGHPSLFNHWYLQPQAQISWMGVKADDHTESNGTRVSGDGDGNVMMRLGLKTYLNNQSGEMNARAVTDNKAPIYQVSLETNWIHNTRRFSARMDDMRISQDGEKNLGEIRLGGERYVTSGLSLWGNVGLQVGAHDYSDTRGMLGVKYTF